MSKDRNSPKPKHTRKSQRRAASCDSTFRDGRRRQPRPSVSPLVAWDDSALHDKHYIPFRDYDDFFPLEDASFPLEDAHIKSTPTTRGTTRDTKRGTQFNRKQHYLYLKTQSGGTRFQYARMGIAIRRTETVNVFQDSTSEEYLSSGPSSPAESHSAEGFAEKRFSQPVEYFRELDGMAFEIYQNSVFEQYIDGTKHRSFDTAIFFDSKIPFLENASFQQCGTEEIIWFCREVINLVNENAPAPSQSSHLVDHRMHNRVLDELNNFIECRNIISRTWENIKTMKKAHYCDSLISLLVLDRTRQNVARLVRIDCGRIEELVITFEICLLQITSGHPNDVLLEVVRTCSSEVSAACRQLLADLDVEIPTELKDLWRCTVHVLDFAVLSYAGAHTQVFGDHLVISLTLPGPFLERQYFGVRRRSFSCLSEFLGQQQAWVLESFDTYLSSLVGLAEPPHLSLSTDAMTFGDIWGPMWKSSVVGNEDQIVHYNVGNGVIVPWHTQSEGSQDEILKGEILCHWMSNKDSREDKDFARASYLCEKDILLIGASVKLEDKGGCPESTAQLRERFRDSGALSEPHTVSPGWELISVAGTLQITPAFVTGGLQKQYKLRAGRYMTKCLIDHWKNDSESRNVEVLEQWLGLEVSACTYNSRRIRLIELFGTQTMLNHLRSASIQWTDPECEKKFYSALQDSDYKAFSRLYKSQRGWQADLGKAIGCGFDKLEDTGKTAEGDLALFWAPDTQPGRKVTLRSRELSWIGFLEETKDSGTLAILESNCLELPNSLIGKICQHDRFDPRHIGGGISPPSQIRDGSLLQTSSHLNEFCVPNSLRGGQRRIKSPSPDGSAPRYEFRWRLTTLKEGDIFGFGAKGHLKVLTQLSRDQVLVEWLSPNRLQDILRDVPHRVLTVASVMPIIRQVVDSPPPLPIHHERIQADDDSSNTKPVHFLIISKSSKMLRSDQSSQRPSLHADSELHAVNTNQTFHDMVFLEPQYGSYYRYLARSR